MNFHQLLEKMVSVDASDMFVTAKLAVSAKINGELHPITEHVLSAEESLAMVHHVMNEKQVRQFDEEKECNFAMSIDDIGRFRISAFWQRDMAGMVIRRIVTDIPDVDESTLLAVDATSGAGQVPLDLNKVDLYFFSPQKIFASEGGFFVCIMSPKAIKRARKSASCVRMVRTPLKSKPMSGRLANRSKHSTSKC